MSDTLLLIEDEPLLSAELVRHFRRAGFEVVTAGTLGEAKRLLLNDEVQPLVVVSDMSLPDGNALDLLEATRSVASGGEWLFLTGYGSISDSVRALRLGAFDFLEKPCDGNCANAQQRRTVAIRRKRSWAEAPPLDRYASCWQNCRAFP